jgi:hypothetical protein
METSVVATRKQSDDSLSVRVFVVARFLHGQQALASPGESRTAITAECRR